MHLLVSLIMIVAVSSSAHAQTGMTNEQMNMINQLQNMTPAQQAEWMQKMQGQATQMASCTAQIDQAKMQALKIRGEQMQKQVQAYCAQGNRAEAQAYAMREGTKMMNDPTVKALKHCSKDMMVKFESMAMGQQAGSKKHICD